MPKPLPQEVAKRLLILKYQVVQGLALPPQELLQNLYSKWSQDERRKFADGIKEQSTRMTASMKSNDLWTLMTGEEKEFIESAPPKVKLQYHLNAVWRLESAAVLLWAMGILREFPPFDTQSDAGLLKQIPHEDAGKFIRSAELLPGEEIERKRSLAELWHWRSRTRQLVEMKKTPPSSTVFSSFDQIVQSVAKEAFQQGDLSRILENDFAAKGKAYRDLTDEEWSEVRSITVERHHALNWLCGYAPGNQWDKTPTET
jgi:hypothetical protein